VNAPPRRFTREAASLGAPHFRCLPTTLPLLGPSCVAPPRQPSAPACPLPIADPTLGEARYLNTISEKTVAEVEVFHLYRMLTGCPHRFNPLLKRAGLPQIRFHDLRHTCATLLLTEIVNLKVVSEMLGHSNIAIILDTYSHVLPNMQESAAAAMEEVLS
jgi:hypothetical protein